MAIGEAIAGAVQGLGKVGIGIYNAWRTQKNQEIQWQREDTALQRRVKDAEAAGFNKWSQLGSSGASSNTTVSAGTADPGMAGAAVDAMSSAYQLAVQKESAKIAKLDREIKENERNISFRAENIDAMNAALKEAELMRMMGFKVGGFEHNVYRPRGSDQDKHKYDVLYRHSFGSDPYNDFVVYSDQDRDGLYHRSDYAKSPAKSLLDMTIMDSIWKPYLTKNQAIEAGKKNKWHDTLNRWRITNDIVRNILSVGNMM